LARASTGATKAAKASKKSSKKQAKKAAAPIRTSGKTSPAKTSPVKTSAAKTSAAKKSPAKKSSTKKSAKTGVAKTGVAKTGVAKTLKAGSRTRDASLDKFLEEQKRALQSERESYASQAEMLKAEADQMAQEAEPGDVQFDEESGEGGTMNIDRERDLALSAQARGAVEDIDLALEKITGGTYGTCERCGQPIPRARLKALPQARLCVACKSGGLSRR
jgi:RNA polymerase-binding transcription factor DksA